MSFLFILSLKLALNWIETTPFQHFLRILRTTDFPSYAITGNFYKTNPYLISLVRISFSKYKYQNKLNFKHDSICLDLILFTYFEIDLLDANLYLTLLPFTLHMISIITYIFNSNTLQPSSHLYTFTLLFRI